MTINFLPIFDSWCGEGGNQWHPCFMTIKRRGNPETINGHVETGKTCKHDDRKNPHSKAAREELNAAVWDAYKARDPGRLRYTIERLLRLVMCAPHAREFDAGNITRDVREWVNTLAEMVSRRKPDDVVPKFDESKFGSRRTKKRKLSAEDPEDPLGSQDVPQRKFMRYNAGLVSAEASPYAATGLASNSGALDPDLFDSPNSPFRSDSIDPALRGPVNSEGQSSLHSASAEIAVHDHAGHTDQSSCGSRSLSSSSSSTAVSTESSSTSQASFGSDSFDLQPDADVNFDLLTQSHIQDLIPVCSFCGRDAGQNHKPLCQVFQSNKAYVSLGDYCLSGRCIGGTRSFCDEDACWNLWCEDETHRRWSDKMHASTCFWNLNMTPAEADSPNSSADARIKSLIKSPAQRDERDSEVAEAAGDRWNEWEQIEGPQIMEQVTNGSHEDRHV